MSKQSMIQNPTGCKPFFSRQLSSVYLAANNCVTETPFGWHVTDVEEKYLVISTHHLYLCSCNQPTCPHTLAVAIVETAAERVQHLQSCGQFFGFTEKVRTAVQQATNQFERLALQTLLNASIALQEALEVERSSLPIDQELEQVQGQLSDLFRLSPTPSSRKRQHKANLTSKLWSPRPKPARPTDQQSAGLTPYQLRLLIEGEASPFRKITSHAHPETDSQVSHSELVWLYERTADTFGQEIVDELFTLHVGSRPYDDECHLKVDRMEPLYEAFVDTFGETDAHLLFADALCLQGEESTTPQLETVPTY